MKKVIIALCLFVVIASVQAQDYIPEDDVYAYIQGFIDVKYNNLSQVLLRGKSTKQIKLLMNDSSFREYSTLVRPRSSIFLLYYRKFSVLPVNIDTPKDFEEEYNLRTWKLKDSIINFTPTERAVLYLALKEVPINEIFVRKEDYNKSIFFQKVSISLIDESRMQLREKCKKNEVSIVAFLNQFGHYLYTIKFNNEFKRQVISLEKKYIPKKFKKNEIVVHNL